MKRFSLVLTCVLFCAMGFWGCSGQPKKVQEPTFMDEWKKKAERSAGYSPSVDALDIKPGKIVEKPVEESAPAEPAAEQKAPAEKTAPPVAKEKPLPKDKVSLKMHDVELSTLLRALARIADQNILINENVEGTTSVNINNTSWDQVFLSILKGHGLKYKWEGEIIRVVTIADMQNEVALMNEEQKYEESIKQHQVKMKSLEAKEKRHEPLVTKIIHIGFADPQVLKENLDSLIEAGAVSSDTTGSEENAEKESGKIPGSIIVDNHTRSLIIQTIPSVLDRILPIIKQLDRPTPQFVIEAQIVEATQSAARDLGVQWGGLYLNASGDSFNWIGGDTTTSTGQQLYTDPNTPTFVQPSTANIVNAGASAISQGGALAYQLQKKGVGLLNVQLKALESKGELNVLSSPFITTLDNKPAFIESGQEIPYQTVEDGEVKIEFKKALVRLEVTPSVINEDTLRMDIKVTKDEPDFGNTVGGQPTIITRRTETTVVLFDNQTMVVSGLSKKTISDNQQGVPGVKEVPLLGFLFRGSEEDNDLDELLIFITPHILKKRGIDMGN